MYVKCSNILPQKVSVTKALQLNWFRFGFKPMRFYGSICTGSARPSHVWPDSGFLCRGALLRRHGVHLHWRGQHNQGQAALQRSGVPPLRRPVERLKQKMCERGGALPPCSTRIEQYVCLQVWPILLATAYTSTGSPGHPLPPVWHLESWGTTQQCHQLSVSVV